MWLEDGLEQRTHPLCAQPIEGELGDKAIASKGSEGLEERMPSLHIVATVRAEKGDPRMRQLTNEKADEREARFIRPLEVVEHDEERRVLGKRVEDLLERDRDPVTLEKRRRRRPCHAAPELREQRRGVRAVLGDEAPERAVAFLTFGRAHRSNERPIGQACLGLEGGPPEQFEATMDGEFGRFACHGGLADAGFPGDHREAPLTFGGVGEKLYQTRELFLATHDDRADKLTRWPRWNRRTRKRYRSAWGRPGLV